MALNITYAAPSVVPIGSKLTISENGQYDVTDYAVADVNVSGGGGLPEVTSANLNSGVSVQYVKGDVLIPEAEYHFAGDYIKISETIPEWFTNGRGLFAEIDGNLYYSAVTESEFGLFVGFENDILVLYTDIELPDGLYMQGEQDAVTVTIYDSAIAWATDPYIGYDIVVSTGADLTNELSNYTFEKLNMQSVVQKVREGKPVTGILYQHSNYDEDIDGDTDLIITPLETTALYSGEGHFRFRKVSGAASGNALTVQLFNITFTLKTYDQGDRYSITAVETTIKSKIIS